MKLASGIEFRGMVDPTVPGGVGVEGAAIVFFGGPEFGHEGLGVRLGLGFRVQRGRGTLHNRDLMLLLLWV